MSPRPVLAAATVVVLAAGIAVAVIRPGDLGDDGGIDTAQATTTTTAPAAEPGTTVPADPGTDGAGGGDGPPAPPPAPAPGDEGTATTTATTTPVGPTPAAPDLPSPNGARAPPAASTGEPPPSPMLAHTGGSDQLAPLAVVLVAAGAVGLRRLTAG